MRKDIYHRFLLLSGLSCLIFLLIISCQSKPVELTFAAGPDDTGSLQHLVDQFNKSQKGKIKVNWKQTSPITDEAYEELQNDFKSALPQIDVFSSDVIWTATLGKEGMAEDLSKQFYNTYKPQNFMQASMNSGIYNFRVYGVPWFTDAAMIFYRKDLLKKHGFHSPPTTWDELERISTVIMEAENMPYGYVFQGDKYEGGVTNACEFIWNAGGQITIDNLSVASDFNDDNFIPNIIAIDSKASEDGFRIARNLIEKGISPETVVNYREQEATKAFLDGKAIFVRAWPGLYGHFLEKDAALSPVQVGVHSIPVLEKGKPSFSCLGGWNLMVAAHTTERKKEAAWEFIQYLTAAPQQRYRAIRSGTLPSLKLLYEDEELLAKVPVIKLAKQEIHNAKSRPVSAHYMQYSPEIAIIFNQMLKGEILPEYAVFSLQQYLENIQLQGSVADN